MYELVCPGCGDHPDLDYSEISPRLQWLRGPYMLEAALAAFPQAPGGSLAVATVEPSGSGLADGQDRELDNELSAWPHAVASTSMPGLHFHDLRHARYRPTRAAPGTGT